MIFFKLCNAIIHKNKVFTIGLFFMAFFSISIAVLGANFGGSVDNTILSFISDGRMPEAVFTTQIMSADDVSTIESINGVKHASPRFFYDTHMEGPNGNSFAVRAFSWDEEASFKQTIQDEPTINRETSNNSDISDESLPRVFLSRDFANYNNIHPLDQVQIDTPIGTKKVVIEGIVSNYETMDCVKDEMSTYEGFQFGYIYIKNDELDKLIYTNEIVNQWLIYFDDNLSPMQEKTVMKDLKDSLGSSYISSIYTDESESMNALRDDLGSIGVMCKFIPGVIWLISLFFSFIFIRIIIESQRKTIGLLRALGFTKRKVTLVFMCYTVMINIVAAIFGIPVGYKLLDMCLKVTADTKGIANISIVINYPVTIGVVIVTFAIGIIASLLTARYISDIDPCEAYGGIANNDFEVPKFIAELKTGAFLKISIVSMVKNYKRQILGSLSICACIISMCVGLEGYKTVGCPIDAVFGDRMQYDLMVRNLDDVSCRKIKDGLQNVGRAELQTCFQAELLDEDVRVATVSEDNTMINLVDASGKRLLPGDGIIIDEMKATLNGIKVGDTVELDDTELEVTGIAREILYNVMYVSPQTAKKLGQDSCNAVMLRLDDNADVNSIKQKILDIDDGAYVVEFDSQKENIIAAFYAMRLVMLVFAILAFCVGSLLVLNLTIIDITDKKNKFAMLRALGVNVSKLGIVSAIENMIRVVIGILPAIPLCTVCVNILIKLLSNPSQQYIMVDFGMCLSISCLMPLIYIILGLLISVIWIKKMDFNKYLSEVD